MDKVYRVARTTDDGDALYYRYYKALAPAVNAVNKNTRIGAKSHIETAFATPWRRIFSEAQIPASEGTRGRYTDRWGTTERTGLKPLTAAQAWRSGNAWKDNLEGVPFVEIRELTPWVKLERNT